MFDAVKAKAHIVEWIHNYFEENGKNSIAVVGISGGKDSTIAAALCVEALGPNRVLGVLMPEGKQEDIDYAYKAVEALGINSRVINIKNICKEFYNVLDVERGSHDEAVFTNTPARIRMSMLYAIAALYGGRVCCTDNFSERYIGYSTKWGDNVGDFAPLANFTCSEVIAIGYELPIPTTLIEKTPSDGMCGKTDEDNFGFTYNELDKFLTDREIGKNYQKIEERHTRNQHKLRTMPICPSIYTNMIS